MLKKREFRLAWLNLIAQIPTARQFPYLSIFGVWLAEKAVARLESPGIDPAP
jgi:hypothetical protein